MNTLKRKAGTLILVFMAAMLSVEAQAAKIVVNFEAEVAYLDDAVDFLQGKVQVGDSFRGTYAHESTTLDTNPFSTFIPAHVKRVVRVL